MTLRVHLGCAGRIVDGWLNVDSDPRAAADVHSDPFDFILRTGDDIGELYLGQLVERLSPDDAEALLSLISERVPPLTAVSAAAVDIRGATELFATGRIDIAQFNSLLVHAAEPGGCQRWSYDARTLAALFERSGLANVAIADATALPDVELVGTVIATLRCAAAGTTASSGRRHPGRGVATPPQERVVVSLVGDGLGRSASDALAEEVRGLRAELIRLRQQQVEALRRGARADRLHAELLDTQATLAGVTGSVTYRAAHAGSLIARRLLPVASRRRRFAVGLLRAVFSARAPVDDEALDA